MMALEGLLLALCDPLQLAQLAVRRFEISELEPCEVALIPSDEFRIVGSTPCERQDAGIRQLQQLRADLQTFAGVRSERVAGEARLIVEL